MRPSKRESILEAAFEVIERDGVAGLTFEAVAERCGLSRAGLLYHFGTREALFQALHEQRAARWEDLLVAALGGTPESATPDERLAAYARVSVHGATGGELLLMLEASRNPEYRAAYTAVSRRWLPDFSEVSPDDPVAISRLLAVLAADGLWTSDSVGELTLSPSLRSAIAARIAATLAEDVSAL
jgi:AcrR family transcriptional regulator